MTAEKFAQEVINHIDKIVDNKYRYLLDLRPYGLLHQEPKDKDRYHRTFDTLNIKYRTKTELEVAVNKIRVIKSETIAQKEYTDAIHRMLITALQSL